MAEAAVQFVVEKIGTVLMNELSLPAKVDREIKNLRLELEMMTAFLKEADERGELDHQTLVWVRLVREQAHEIDNVLHMFSFHMAEKRVKWFTRWWARHSIADVIDNINSSLKTIKESKERYQNTISFQVLRTRPAADFHPRMAPLYLPDADVVGFEKDKDMLMSWALDDTDVYKVMFLVGMGGSGKTTLAKQVYEAVKTDFDCHAWISVSKSKKLDTLWTLLDRLCNSRPEITPHLSFSTAVVEVDDLINRLQNFLTAQRYVIVLDDLWIDDIWEFIKFALPRANGSRIIITTRRGDIANSRRDRSIDVHNIKRLSLKKANTLFHRKAFPKNVRCPPGLDGWSSNILRKCEGLPLAIIEIGQVLSTKLESETEWKKLHDGLVSELRSNGCLSNIMRVLILSYNDLPYHLKYCFLFMNTFPRDYPIQRRKLVQLWIAEGFIRDHIGKELEDVGEEYLKELIERSMVEVCEIDFDGRPRTCRVHNIIHEIVLSKLLDENFCEVYPEHGKVDINETTRRISIHQSELGRFCPNVRARTLLMFGSLTTYCRVRYSSFELLTVLHLEGAPLDVFPAEIEELLLLRYLCLRNTRIGSIPKSLGKLRHLETLDLKQTFVAELPKEICHLDKLRNLFVYRYDIMHLVDFNSVKGFEVSTEIKSLVNLRKLSFVKVHQDNSIIIAMRDLRKLRKLGIIDLHVEDGKILCETVQRLPNLYSLNVTAKIEEEILDMQEVTNPPPLQRLYLKGRLEKMPVWISKLHDLVRLRLKWSRLTQSNNPIDVLQDLPNLLELQLLDAYTGNQLDFNDRKFPKLKRLEFEKLEQLVMVMMDTDTLPCLETLIIRRCSQLRQIPIGIEKRIHLKELHLYDMPLDFVSMLQKTGGNLHHVVRHIPLIRSYYAEEGGQWIMEVLS